MDKQILRNYNLIPQKGEVGVEIEMEGRFPFMYNMARAPKDWFWTHDGSLRGESAEFVFDKPLSQIDSIKAVDRLYDFFKSYKNCKLTPSKRCGVHVHINVQTMLEKEVFNMILLYVAFEGILMKWCGKDRCGNLFCLRSSDAEEFVMALANCRVKKSLRGMALDARFRYSSLNINALAKFGSLEFRGLGTPKSPTKIKTWIRMLLSLKKKGQQYNSPDEIVMDMSAKGVDEWIAEVFGPKSPLLKLGTPENRESIIRLSIRHVQDAILMEPMYIIPYIRGDQGYIGENPGRIKRRPIKIGDVPRFIEDVQPGLPPRPIPVIDEDPEDLGIEGHEDWFEDEVEDE